MSLMFKNGQEVVKHEPRSNIYFVQKVIGNDTYTVLAQSSVELEDEFSNLYYSTSDQAKLFLAPPFDPSSLKNYAYSNNILSQCIDAMEVNVDGTGYTFESVDPEKEPDQGEMKIAKSFFNEPFPNQNFIKIRRKLRREIEAVGYGFLEILRNLAGDIIGLRNIETPYVRFVKLDAPIFVEKEIERDGKTVTLKFLDRERRFAQRVAAKDLIYYREFGSTRQINRVTGDWETDGTPVKPEDRGSELLVFGINPDVVSPYFLPRWINELPSVIGSRKAEEQNLQFLDSGGLPPAIIFVQGGVLSKDTADQLRLYLSGQNKNKYRAVVVEAQSSSGSLDAAGNVQVKVERFGSQAAQDAMFMKYDDATEEHVRKGFRLPELFIGKSEALNFATALTSYMIAEAQIFAPERDAFDAVITSTILNELGLKTIRIKSKPITLNDIASQLKGLDMSKDMATRESFLKEVNTATGMDLTLAAMPTPDTVTATVQEGGGTGGAGGGGTGSTTEDSTVPPDKETVHQTPHEELPASTKPPQAVPQHKVVQLPSKSVTGKVPNQNKKVPKTAQEVIELANTFAGIRGLTKKVDISPHQVLQVMEEIKSLTTTDQIAFNNLVASHLYGVENIGDEDLVELASYVPQVS